MGWLGSRKTHSYELGSNSTKNVSAEPGTITQLKFKHSKLIFNTDHREARAAGIPRQSYLYGSLLWRVRIIRQSSSDRGSYLARATGF